MKEGNHNPCLNEDQESQTHFRKSFLTYLCLILPSLSNVYCSNVFNSTESHHSYRDSRTVNPDHFLDAPKTSIARVREQNFGQLPVQQQPSKRKMQEHSDSDPMKDFLELPEESYRRPVLSEDCDLWQGRWVYDESYPLWDWTVCPFGNDGFNCPAMGRNNLSYLKFRWQPKGCNVVRFNAVDFRLRMRGHRLAFVGDSLARNQFISLLCMASRGADVARISEVTNTTSISQSHPHVVFRFEEYNFTVEYFRSPWLVTHTRAPPQSPAHVKAVLRLDEVDSWAWKLSNVDFLILNLGHWLTNEKLTKRGSYLFHDENIRFDIGMAEAYTIILETIIKWSIDLSISQIPPKIFFRNYSPVHTRFRRGRTWNYCVDNLPKVNLSEVEISRAKEVFLRWKSDIVLLDTTVLSSARGDAHLARIGGRNKGSDCSHWCLPGLPDIWNELLYNNLIANKIPPFD